MQGNPLNDGIRIEPAPGPASIVIFGATGDLARRKLFPALHRLARHQRLPPRFSIIGVARSEGNDDTLRQRFRDSLKEFGRADDPREVSDALVRNVSYISGETSDPAIYTQLRDRLASEAAAGGALFYLAIPPSAYAEVIRGLGEAGLSKERSPTAWRRVIVEKPFGRDLDSARSLNRLLHQHFDEPQVFRIDHYLGKETVQNLLVFRFANGMFEPVWNRRYVDHVQITAAETVGVEGRGGYYEGAGAVRDMVQNHLLQLATLVAMEPPTSFTAESVRDRKMDALLSVQPLVREGSSDVRVVRAQYAAGWVDGREVPGYREEPSVAADSSTETFAAVQLALDSWRWAGVPFYLRTGKRLPKRTTEIAIQFKRPPLEIFRRVSASPVAPTLLIINVQPDEGISLRFEAKLPGTRMQLAPVMMQFHYRTAFGAEIPEAYETLLLDALIGEPTLFARHDFVEAAWSLITPVHERWAGSREAVSTYEAGEWGPPDADALVAKEGHRWRTL